MAARTLYATTKEQLSGVLARIDTLPDQPVTATLFVNPVCPFCIKAKASLINKLGPAAVTIVSIQESELRLQLYELLAAHRDIKVHTVPQIFVSSHYLPGGSAGLSACTENLLQCAKRQTVLARASSNGSRTAAAAPQKDHT